VLNASISLAASKALTINAFDSNFTIPTGMCWPDGVPTTEYNATVSVIYSLLLLHDCLLRQHCLTGGLRCIVPTGTGSAAAGGRRSSTVEVLATAAICMSGWHPVSLPDLEEGLLIPFNQTSRTC
jgi:hypothetical protein